MVELYRTEFVPELEKMLSSEIDQLTDFIEKASQSNRLRWRIMYDNLSADVVHTPEALKDYFSRRVQFLNRAWLNDVPYCTVQFEYRPGQSFLTISVEKGHCLETSFINIQTGIWADIETGEIFDFRQPVMEDMIVARQYTETSAS